MNKRTKALRQGQTVWHVHAFNEKDGSSSGWVDEYRVLGPARHSEFGPALFVPVLSNGYKTEFSTKDANYSELNHYNQHRLFTSRRRALRYLAQCEAGCFDTSAPSDHGMFDDHYDYDDLHY